jgi:glycosidase
MFFAKLSVFAAGLCVAVLPAGAQDDYLLVSRRDGNPSYRYMSSPADWRDVNIYQLFTDRFYDGNSGNNTSSELSMDRSGWYVGSRSYPDNRNYHHGGDWAGLRQKLDYLDNMGVKAIWMSGVQMNAQGRDTRYTPYHMYHPTDFWRADPVMGTFQELKDLIDDCHDRGIYVILDVVINHMADLAGLPNGDDDKWYWPSGNGTYTWWDANKRHRGAFDRLDWFHNNGTINCWDCYPENVYGQFKGTDDLATERSDVQNELDLAFKNLIAATDCDGFRVDAIKHVEYDWIKQWADDMRQYAASLGKDDFILFGEYFSYDNSALASYCKDEGYSFNSALFFPMANTIKSVFKDGGWTGQLTQSRDAMNQYGEGANRLVAFIDNHDVNRIALHIGGDAGHVTWMMKPALTWLYTGLPVPCLYYGTEHAFNQGGHWNGSSASGDNDDADHQRECMFDRGFQPGNAGGDKFSGGTSDMYDHIAALNSARETYRSLTRGSFTERWQEGGAGAYAFSRVYNDEESLVALNTSDSSRTIDPEVDASDGTSFENVLNPGETVTVSGGRISFSLNGKESKIFVAGGGSTLFINNTYNWPADGDLDPGEELWINTEAGPEGASTNAFVAYSTDGGTTWTNAQMSADASVSGYDGWHVNLSSFPADTVIEYAVAVQDASTEVWDNNGGANFSVTVNAGSGADVDWTPDSPENCGGSSVTITYTPNDGPLSGSASISIMLGEVLSTGTNWAGHDMTQVGATWSYTHSIDTDCSRLQFAFYNGESVWDNNNENDWSITVDACSGDPSLVEWTPYVPTNCPGSTLDVSYTPNSGPLSGATNVSLAYGYFYATETNWSDVAMTTNGSTFEQTINVPTNVQQIQICFTDGVTWDNNDSGNWQINVANCGGDPAPTLMGGSPTLADDPVEQNAVSETFDFVTSETVLRSADAGGFGTFGDIYFNYDDTYLYVGAKGCDVGGDNNAGIMFLGVNTLAHDATDLTGRTGTPTGLVELANVAFSEGMDVAILFGDEWGDGNYANFNLASEYDFGQGIFALGASTFDALSGSRLSQYDSNITQTSDDDGNRRTDNWEARIPWSDLGATNVFDLTVLNVAGLFGNDSVVGGARYVSGNYLGDNAVGPLDAYDNFGFSNVTIYPVSIGLPSALTDSDDDGMPDDWEDKYGLLSGDPSDANSDDDLDGYSNYEEYLAGTSPTNAASVFETIPSLVGNSMRLAWTVSDAGRAYDVYRCTNLAEGSFTLVGENIEGTTPEVIFLDADTEYMPNAFYRLRAQVTGGGEPPQSVDVYASPGGGTFVSDSGVSVTLYASGNGITSATYAVDGGSAAAYTSGDQITVGAGLTNGESTELVLEGYTGDGQTDTETYTYTKTEDLPAVTWIGNVTTVPGSGDWDYGETLDIQIESTPIGAGQSAGMVYTVDGGSSWSNAALSAGTGNASNDLWEVTLGSYPSNTTLEFALVVDDAQGDSHWANNGGANYSITVNGNTNAFIPGGSRPYSVNPTLGQYRSAGITIDGANTGGEWTTNMLIALDVANDDPRTLGDNWTTHEAPLDLTHLWACWDDSNLYIAWQFVDVTDVIDPVNAGSGDAISGNDGILIWMVLDTESGGATDDMWEKDNTWSGSDTPDHMIYMAGSLWQSYISHESGGVFPVDAPGYTNCSAAGIDIDVGATLVPSTVWGPYDCDNRNTQAQHGDFVAQGHSATHRDSFYEMSIPLSELGLNRAQLESGGIGVQIGAGSTSSMDCIPNDPATTDTPGVEVYNSSFEWGDSDIFTVDFARIGAP